MHNAPQSEVGKGEIMIYCPKCENEIEEVDEDAHYGGEQKCKHCGALLDLCWDTVTGYTVEGIIDEE